MGLDDIRGELRDRRSTGHGLSPGHPAERQRRGWGRRVKGQIARCQVASTERASVVALKVPVSVFYAFRVVGAVWARPPKGGTETAPLGRVESRG